MSRRIGIDHIAEQECRAFLLDRCGKKLQRRGNVGTVGRRLQFQHLPDYMQKMAAPFSRRNELFDPVAEEQHPHLVVIEGGAERQHGSNFRQKFPFGADTGSEQTGPAHVHQQHHRHLPLFFEHLHVRAPHSGGNIPVHIPHIVTVLIFTHFAESHPPPLECGMILSRKNLVGKRLGTDFYLPYLLQQFCCVSTHSTEPLLH